MFRFIKEFVDNSSEHVNGLRFYNYFLGIKIIIYSFTFFESWIEF